MNMFREWKIYTHTSKEGSQRSVNSLSVFVYTEYVEFANQSKFGGDLEQRGILSWTQSSDTPENKLPFSYDSIWLWYKIALIKTDAFLHIKWVLLIFEDLEELSLTLEPRTKTPCGNQYLMKGGCADVRLEQGMCPLVHSGKSQAIIW